MIAFLFSSCASIPKVFLISVSLLTHAYTEKHRHKVHFSEYAAIYTRHRIPSAETIFTAQKMAQLSGIKISQMIKVLQHSCPADS